MRHVPLSVIVPVRNEAKNIQRCLESVKWAGEVFVVDSASTDGTVELAEKAGAKVVQFRLNGAWPKKKNWALESLPFTHDWVFILDADEVLPGGAEEEFARIVTSAERPCAGYWINRRFMFMGKWLRHAYYPNWNLRLFLHREGRYEKLTDSETNSGDNEVHEHIIVHGKTGYLTTEMDHYAFPSIDVFMEKHNRYANWEARVAVDGLLQSSDGKLSLPNVQKRRWLKRMSQRWTAVRPALRFLYVYVWQRGFLDGWEGYCFARLHAVYELLCVLKTEELRRTLGAPGREVSQ